MLNYNTDSTSDKIMEFISELSTKEKSDLLKAFEYKKSLKEAKRLNKSVKLNTVTMKEICDIVREVRYANR